MLKVQLYSWCRAMCLQRQTLMKYHVNMVLQSCDGWKMEGGALLTNKNTAVANQLYMPHRTTKTLSEKVLERHRHSPLNYDKEHIKKPPTLNAPENFLYAHPDFLPRPEWYNRDRLLEKLQRQDMLKRRNVIKIPEFYVGCIMAVTISDKYAPEKSSRFVGICIDREYTGLASVFVLRNHIDGVGVELTFEMYSPIILKIEVLKLEKRLDHQMFYLRDAPDSYSTFPQNFELVPHIPGNEVPVNREIVQLNDPDTWERKWHLKHLKGISYVKTDWIIESTMRNADIETREKLDVIEDMRRQIDPNEVTSVMSEIHAQMKEREETKLQEKRSAMAKRRK